MATYYVGPASAGAADGSSWANRYGSLNDAEDTPVVAGDQVIVGPGVYRERLLIDVAGGAGTPITYTADVTGRQTDGVGGVVRVTGSDDDQTTTRLYCIQGSAGEDYRTFTGFTFDGCTVAAVYGDTCDNWIIQDCAIQNTDANGIRCDDGTDWTIRRCVLVGVTENAIFLDATAAAIDSTDHLIENCLIIGTGVDGIRVDQMGDMTIKNCIIMGTGDDGIDVAVAPNAGHPVLVYNCLIMMCAGSGLEATAAADMTENYNNLWGNATDRTNVNVGANSQAYIPLFNLPLLLDGYRFPPPLLGELSEWSALRRITGTATPNDDLLGFTRPTTAAKLSWGPLQFQDSKRDTGTVYDSSTASLEVPDVGKIQFIVPVDAVETTIQVRVNRQANYAGNLPRMVIREPGQSDRNTVDVGAVSTWNQLLDTFTPSGDTDFVTVILESRNTAAAGNYAVFFDDLFVR